MAAGPRAVALVVLLGAGTCAPDVGIRVNKCLRASHSRREADRLVQEGRVTVNGRPAFVTHRVLPGDDVRLDGRVVDWERLNVPARDGQPGYIYVKYWKPRGVECTTDLSRRRNVLSSLGPLPGVEDRIVPVGRLDMDSTGLLLLTSDGPVINRLLRSREKRPKVYTVTTRPRATKKQIERMAAGITITTTAQRDGGKKVLTAPTLPCVVERTANGRGLRFELTEGRNRQIRRMCTAVGLEVVSLHRVAFAGITLEGCEGPGDWAFLTAAEERMLVDGSRGTRPSRR